MIDNKRTQSAALGFVETFLKRGLCDSYCRQTVQTFKDAMLIAYLISKSQALF